MEAFDPLTDEYRESIVSPDEVDAMKAKQEAYGWTFYFQVNVRENGKIMLTFTKPKSLRN
jgi:hypothetical protein